MWRVPFGAIRVEDFFIHGFLSFGRGPVNETPGYANTTASFRGNFSLTRRGALCSKRHAIRQWRRVHAILYHSACPETLNGPVTKHCARILEPRSYRSVGHAGFEACDLGTITPDVRLSICPWIPGCSCCHRRRALRREGLDRVLLKALLGRRAFRRRLYFPFFGV